MVVTSWTPRASALSAPRFSLAGYTDGATMDYVSTLHRPHPAPRAPRARRTSHELYVRAMWETFALVTLLIAAAVYGLLALLLG